MRRRNDSDKDEWKLKGDTRLRHGALAPRAGGEVERERRTGARSRTTGSWTTTSIASSTNTGSGVAAIRRRSRSTNLERQSALGTGPGYQFWDDELGRFDLVAEISRWQLEWRDQPREDFTSYSLEWDYKRLLAGTRLELYSKGTVLVPGIERTTCSTANTACALSAEQLGASFVPL